MKSNFIIPVLLLSLIFNSCKTGEKVQSSVAHQSATLKKENKYSLMTKIKSRNFNFKWLSAHFTVNMSIDTAEQSFSGIVRIRKDSIIWMNISALVGTVSVARVKLNQDSVMFLDYIHDMFFKGNYDYISDSILGEEVDFDLLNSVMLGNSLEFYNDTAKMRAYDDGKDHILSTMRKRKIKKLMFKNKSIRSKDDAQLIWLDPVDFHIKKVRLEDFYTHRIFEATYDDFEKVDSTMFPTHIHYEIDAEKVIKIDLKYKRVSFSNEEKVPFTIPAKYERIRY